MVKVNITFERHDIFEIIKLLTIAEYEAIDEDKRKYEAIRKYIEFQLKIR